MYGDPLFVLHMIPARLSFAMVRSKRLHGYFIGIFELIDPS